VVESEFCWKQHVKKKLILHIGMGKTGTSALQDFFWANRALLEKNGLDYPKYGAVSYAHHLLSPHVPKHMAENWRFKSFSEWAEKLKHTPLDTILLSSELIAWASRDQVIEYCQCLKEHFHLTVVIYVRRQDNIIMANYNQLVKVGWQKSEIENVWQHNLLKFNYRKIIEPWATCLGNLNIVVRPYEKQQFHRGDIRYDFLFHVFGIEEYEEFAMPRGNPNPRLNASAVSYKLQRYRAISDPAKVALFNDALLSYSAASDSADNSIFSSQPLLSEDSRNQIIRRFSAINDYIAREYLAREDGVLFLDPLPSPRGQGTSQSLTADESKQITQYVVGFKPELRELIYKKNVQGSSSIDLSRKAAARLLKIRATPIVIDGVVRRSPVSYFRWGRRSEKSQPRQKQKMLMSLHLPAVTVDGYLAEVDEHCIESIVEDYMDKPMGASSALRKATALRGCFRYARQAYVSEKGICVHGNFMPLKYRFFESRLEKRYVTWIKDPVERLWAHYVLWRSDLDSDNELRRRMLDEDWSFERFANCPTIRNIYSQYFWGFPLKLFDFIGISEFATTEIQRFSIEILGCVEQKMILNDSAKRHEAASSIDPKLRKHIERYHSEDMALYRHALQIRDRQLEKLGILKGEVL
jgi:hypothetical protein